MLAIQPLRWRSMPQRPLRTACCESPDPDVEYVAPGLYYNRRLRANNVWEIDLDASVIGSAERLFYEGEPFESVTAGMDEPYDVLETSVGDFFAQRVTWDSNIAWISVDEASSFAHFQSMWQQQLELDRRFASVVPHTRRLQLYSSFFVARTWCRSHNFHFDYKPPVGCDALTLITPLRDYEETDSFQMTYRARDPSGERCWDERYEYKLGKALVFGSQFEHSTEPGRGQDGEPHAFLCFTFGTDRQERWAEIARTLDTQSRIVAHPDGQLQLSRLGEEIERIIREHASAAVPEGAEEPGAQPEPLPLDTTDERVASAAVPEGAEAEAHDGGT